jgi:hypothetical protein
MSAVSRGREFFAQPPAGLGSAMRLQEFDQGRHGANLGEHEGDEPQQQAVAAALDLERQVPPSLGELFLQPQLDVSDIAKKLLSLDFAT